MYFPANCDNSKTPHRSGSRRGGECGKMLCRFLSTAKWPLRDPVAADSASAGYPGASAREGVAGVAGVAELGTPRRRVTPIHKNFSPLPPTSFSFLFSPPRSNNRFSKLANGETHASVFLDKILYLSALWGKSPDTLAALPRGGLHSGNAGRVAAAPNPHHCHCSGNRSSMGEDMSLQR